MSERENGKEEMLAGYGQTLASGHERLACESTRHIQNSAWIREIPKNVRALANSFGTAAGGGEQWQVYPEPPTL
jgi:1,4-dihydroxy-2-naphthoyl-CoA synthase